LELVNNVTGWGMMLICDMVLQCAGTLQLVSAPVYCRSDTHCHA